MVLVQQESNRDDFGKTLGAAFALPYARVASYNVITDIVHDVINSLGSSIYVNMASAQHTTLNITFRFHKIDDRLLSVLLREFSQHINILCNEMNMLFKSTTTGTGDSISCIVDYSFCISDFNNFIKKLDNVVHVKFDKEFIQSMEEEISE